MTVQPPARRADAARNRERILEVARTAFAEVDAEVSMAEIARRSGLGSATVYRNFANRRDLLEALYLDEVDAVCTAASQIDATDAGTRFTAWLRRFFEYFTSKRHVAAELLTLIDRSDPVFGASRTRVVAAGAPLLRAAQEAGEIGVDLNLDQILDLIVAIATIPANQNYLQPILETALAGLRR